MLNSFYENNYFNNLRYMNLKKIVYSSLNFDLKNVNKKKRNCQ